MSTTPEQSLPVVVRGVEGVSNVPIGTVLGSSSWVEVTQEAVDLFAEATGDHQWIHVDPERAKDGPFGRTVAHGYFTLSLVPRLMPEVLSFEGFAMGVNYGCDRVRFPAPVPVGSRVRADVTVDQLTEISGGIQATLTMSFEVEGAAKPGCVATILVRHYL